MKIKKYKLNENVSIETLKKNGFKEGGFMNEVPSPKYKYNKYLVDDIELCIEISVNEDKSLSFDDFNNVLVLDDEFCQPYTDFYNTQNPDSIVSGYLNRVISKYNEEMDELVKKGILQEQYKKENKSCLDIYDLVVNLIATLKEAGIDPKRLSYEEIVSYGKKLKEFGEKRDYQFYLSLSRDNTSKFLNNNSYWVEEKIFSDKKGIVIKKDYTYEEFMKLHRSFMPLDALLLIKDNNFKRSIVEDHRKIGVEETEKKKKELCKWGIPGRFLIGNCILNRLEQGFTHRQFNEFYEEVNKKLEDLNYYTHDCYFDEFIEDYPGIVKKYGDVFIPLHDDYQKQKLEAYFRTGLPKDILEAIDESSENIEDTEDDIKEFKKAYKVFERELFRVERQYKKYEKMNEVFINSIEHINYSSENDIHKINIKTKDK